MILYHGTNTAFDKIDLQMSKPNKDFGKGFYLSANPRQAMSLAKARVALTGGVATVLKYDFDETVLTNGKLKVLRFDNYTEEWANFVLANRNNKTGHRVHDYDIVIGPIANDRVGIQLWRYRNHDINMAALIANLKYMKGITFQYYFGTTRAIGHLTKL